jgi:hypothetical protein
LNRRGPTRSAEAIVAILLPPACREEVLGDLHERYRSPLQFAWDVLWTIPMVIVSRIRRTADPQITLLQALGLSVAFLGSAWFKDSALLREPWGLLRTAIPAAMSLLGLLLEDAWADPRRSTARSPARGPLVAACFAILSEGVLAVTNPRLTVSLWVLINGCAMGLLLMTSIRLLFPPPEGQLRGVNAPAAWLKRSGDGRRTGGGRPSFLLIAAAAVFVIVAAWAGCGRAHSAAQSKYEQPARRILWQQIKPVAFHGHGLPRKRSAAVSDPRADTAE